MRGEALRKWGRSLSSQGIFSGMPEELLSELGKIALDKRYEKGELVFYEGDESVGFYQLLSGKVKIYKLSPEGKEQILQFIRPGETFGEVVVFSGKTFPAHAEAVQPSRVLLFPRKDFIEMIQRNPDLALVMLAILSERLRHFTVQVENLSLKEVPSRLASYLLYLSREGTKGDTVTLDISKGQLANLLGTVPETFSRILRRMTDRGIIDVQGRQIRLLKLHQLMALAEGERLT